MDVFDVNVENRTKLGTSMVRKLKREGMIPGILYQGGDSLPIMMKEAEVRQVFTGNPDEDLVLNVSFNNKQFKAKVKEVQREPVHGDILHVDLMPLEATDYIQ